MGQGIILNTVRESQVISFWKLSGNPDSVMSGTAVQSTLCCYLYFFAAVLGFYDTLIIFVNNNNNSNLVGFLYTAE